MALVLLDWLHEVLTAAVYVQKRPGYPQLKDVEVKSSGSLGSWYKASREYTFITAGFSHFGQKKQPFKCITVRGFK